MRKLFLFSFFLLLPLILLSCDSNDPERDISGTWELETINGKPLPFVFDPDIYGFEGRIESVVFTLNRDKTYLVTIIDNFGTDKTEGTWELSGDTITFLPTNVNNETLTAKIESDDSFVLEDNSSEDFTVVFVFRRTS